MSARMVSGGGFIAGNAPANDDDFSSSRASSFDAARRDPVQWRVHYPADIGEVLSGVEDLWLRIVRQPTVHATVLRSESTGERLVMFRLTGKSTDPECCQLLADASSGDSYLWSQEGCRGSLVADIQWIGSTLVIELTSARQMQRAPDGETLVCSMNALLQRIQRMGRRE
ncbi:hypothetical protein DIC66_13875 [Rhodoferax lacus]|uniref:Uncharacterized protein n=1 Tax=Rhodoferax lacus TaxID=2184758 RepID=A0A3E1RAJ4_9BURK|nr:hypothetical protein [Rhodoferax lacus]RFO96389.1 hypothetical protein DIC66_13875 [Rhodoferax lacus]